MRSPSRIDKDYRFGIAVWRPGTNTEFPDGAKGWAEVNLTRLKNENQLSYAKVLNDIINILRPVRVAEGVLQERPRLQILPDNFLSQPPRQRPRSNRQAPHLLI